MNPALHHALVGIAGAVVAVAIEVFYKSTALPYLSRVLLVSVPAQILIGWCVYTLVRSTGSPVGAFVIFASSTLGLRVIVTLAMGLEVSSGTWAALVLMGLARVVQAAW